MIVSSEQCEQGLGHTGSGCLVLGPVLSRAKEYCLLECRSQIQEGVQSMDWLVCICNSKLFAISKNWLALGGEISPQSVRPQNPEPQGYRKYKNIVNIHPTPTLSQVNLPFSYQQLVASQESLLTFHSRSNLLWVFIALSSILYSLFHSFVIIFHLFVTHFNKWLSFPIDYTFCEAWNLPIFPRHFFKDSFAG